MSEQKNIVVAGGGAFGTALAFVLASSGSANVQLLVRDEERASAMQETRENDLRLPGVKFPSDLNVTADMDCLKAANIILAVVPSKAQTEFAHAAKPHLSEDVAYVICSKGLDPDGGGLIGQKVQNILGLENIAILSGPGFAYDIAKGLPTAMTLGARDMELAEDIAADLSRKNFRLYASDDPVGVQTGGAVKNVLAIAAGIVTGAGLGDSARASIIARGLAEISRLIVHLGGKPDTASGLSGLGDLVLTASSEQSRNYSFGIEIGKGVKPDDLIGEGRPLVEGAHAAKAVARIASDADLPLPITQSVAQIVNGELSVQDAVSRLLARPLRTENENNGG